MLRCAVVVLLQYAIAGSTTKPCQGMCRLGTECVEGQCWPSSTCSLGAACAATSTCVCAFDHYCCDSDWDTQCVIEAESRCGLECVNGPENLLVNTLCARQGQEITSPCISRAISFQGGGFRAHAVHSGVVAGLIAHAGSLKEVFSGIGGFGSNSGGSWFASMMFFSQQFDGMLQDMADNPANSADVYKASFITPLVEALAAAPTSGSMQIPASIRDWIIQTLQDVGERLADINILLFFLEFKLEWATFVQFFLEAGAPDVDWQGPMSSTPQAWALNKEWFVQGSIIAPQNFANSSLLDNDITTIAYLECKQQLPRIYAPICFNVVMGSNRTIYPFVTRKVRELKFQYFLELYSGSVIDQSQIVSGMWDNVGPSYNLPLLDVVAVSSAFFAKKVNDLQYLTRFGFSAIPILSYIRKFAVYTQNQAGPHMFNVSGINLLNLASLEAARVSILGDGGFVDNQVIPAVLQAGYSTVTVILDANDGKLNSDFNTAFGKLYFPVFTCDQPCYDAKWANFSKFLLPPNAHSFKLLNNIYYGSFGTLTTLAQPWYDIPAGIRVRLNAVVVDNNATLASLQWDVYATLAGEVASTIAFDPAAAAAVLLLFKS